MAQSHQTILRYIGRTPMVALQHIGRALPVSALVKCEHLNPGGSTKNRIAMAIVEDAEARGTPHSGMTLVEATAGNTGLGLPRVAAARGYVLQCVMPEKMSVDKRIALAALGARVVITPNAPPASTDNFRNVAERMPEEHSWLLTDQFRNPVNVRVHEQTTAGEIRCLACIRIAGEPERRVDAPMSRQGRLRLFAFEQDQRANYHLGSILFDTRPIEGS